MHAMATHHGSAGCPLDISVVILAEDPEHTDINSESTHSSDATIALEGPEAIGHPEDLVYGNQDKLTALTRQINDLHQWVVAAGQPAETLDCTEHELQNLSIALHQPPAPAPAEPFIEVIQQYTDTLCTMQKQSNLMNSLLQDIAVFNKHDSTKLEDWLTDIETTANLTTLVTEAITSNKSLVEIKDLLWLKLCNADIHMYTLCFMEIKQWEDSLTAYIHQFKTEAKRCNFTNDAATIQIFIKGLKNAHILATCIYGKGPQTFSNAVSEFEKLNVVQQLTATITPSSTVNMMSNDEECCF